MRALASEARQGRGRRSDKVDRAGDNAKVREGS